MRLRFLGGGCLCPEGLIIGILGRSARLLHHRGRVTEPFQRPGELFLGGNNFGQRAPPAGRSIPPLPGQIWSGSQWHGVLSRSARIRFTEQDRYYQGSDGLSRIGSVEGCDVLERVLFRMLAQLQLRDHQVGGTISIRATASSNEQASAVTWQTSDFCSAWRSPAAALGVDRPAGP